MPAAVSKTNGRCPASLFTERTENRKAAYHRRFFMQVDFESGPVRINKFLSAVGYCSRREADRLIEGGRVRVNGAVAELGTKVEVGQSVTVDGRTVGGVAKMQHIKPALIAMNKPVGIVCATTENDRAETVVELAQYPTRVYPIGRLDKDSEGLILLTNQGDIVNEILKASNLHEKEYLVEVDRIITEGFVTKMREGVFLPELEVTTRPCKVEIRGKRVFSITLTQGLNRQIRRMCMECGYHVTSLKRVRIMNIRLGNLKSGTWRNVTPEELKTLKESLHAD
jgi:23S rRNA pseudouridine2604 synthase